MYNVPIPGQSLTTSPRKYPYERPPEIVDPEEALEMHLSRLGDPERQEAIVDALELDLDIVTITEGILRGAVAGGIHSIDVSMIIAPVVHRFIKKVADDAGIDYDEGLEDKKAKEEGREQIELAKAYKKVKQSSGKEPVEDTPMSEMPEEAIEGLIARRNK